jgi:hypothetical protein
MYVARKLPPRFSEIHISLALMLHSLCAYICDCVMESKTIYDMLWRAKIALTFVLYVLSILRNHQREHFK